MYRILGGLLRHSIGDQGHAAAFLMLQQLYAVAEGVHHLDEILT